MPLVNGMYTTKNIGMLPDLSEFSGGPASFQRKLAAGLSSRGLHACYDPQETQLDALLLINASRHVSDLWRAKRQGVPIVQRLGAPFPSSRPCECSLARRMRVWLGMRNVAYVRSHVAAGVVYQSHFVENCWNTIRGTIRKPSKVIYNGVDLSHFSPEGPRHASKAKVCIISVEGTQPGPEDHPAVPLAERLIAKGLDVELLVFGESRAGTAQLWDRYSFASVRGLVPNADLAFFYRGSTLFISVDVIAACPNSVVEALACGTPVLGYAAGVLPEMLDCGAGRCVPVKGDPWKGEHPGNVDGLVDAALEIIEDNAAFRVNARKLAESRYGLDRMVDEYVEFFSQV